MGGVADMPPDDVDELGVALRRPDRGQVADCGRKRAIGDRHGPRRASEQDWLGRCAVNWHFKSRDGLVGNDLGHQTSAPPPKEKKDRKNELAANAIERPNTIWMRRRKPPLVSPNANVRPVTMMMITAMILETGPSIDCRICWSGCSHGMFEPAA